MPTCRIHHEPCGHLEAVASDSIHVVVTSPPFNLSYRRQKGKNFNIDGYGGFSDHIPEPEYLQQQVDLLDDLGRVLAPDGSVFYNHKNRRFKRCVVSPMEWIRRVTALELHQVIVWDRGSSHNVEPSFLPPTVEYIYWFRKAGCRPRFDKTWRKWGLVWRMTPHAETAHIDHPAPFPMMIPFRCITMSAPDDSSLVLDPYFGSGTTGVAAAMLGLDCVGYEINRDYIELAEKRIAKVSGNTDVGAHDQEGATTRVVVIEECKSANGGKR